VLRTAALPLELFALAACMWAASPLGSVSSAQPFDLNGANVPVAGVPTWPVAAGDVIATHSAPATIKFCDGSRVVLAENSRARLEGKAGKSVFRLLQGSGEYGLAAHHALSRFCARQRGDSQINRRAARPPERGRGRQQRER